MDVFLKCCQHSVFTPLVPAVYSLCLECLWKGHVARQSAIDIRCSDRAWLRTAQYYAMEVKQLGLLLKSQAFSFPGHPPLPWADRFGYKSTLAGNSQPRTAYCIPITHQPWLLAHPARKKESPVAAGLSLTTSANLCH